MSYKPYLLGAALSLLVFGCGKDGKNQDVISQTYVHKYGYAVSEKEWTTKNYPGQVITSLKNGVTVTATYEDRMLHGPYTVTYPGSSVIEKYVLYNENVPVKEIYYDIAGMPVQESTRLSTNRHALTSWYKDGVPKSVEEYEGEELVEGSYFLPDHTLETKVEKGNGLRVVRDAEGVLSCKDLIENGMMSQRDSFYPNGAPESISFYFRGQLHGTRKSFTPSGEPIAVEDWSNGHLHGLSTYYKNGTKELEVYYLYGKKHGTETLFLDGDSVMHQVSWEHGRKHGPETFHLPHETKTLWNYEGREVSKLRFEELTKIESIMSDSTQ